MSPASTVSDGPSDTVRRFVRSTVGDVDRYEDKTVPLGEARVWAVWRGDTVVAWLKRHKALAKAVREAEAYRSWLPALRGGTVALLGVCPDVPRVLLTAPAPGERADRLRLSEIEALDVYREIGGFLARLHALPFPEDDPVPLDDALRARAHAWCDRALDVVDDSLLDAVREAFDTPAPAGLRRVPCHRDLQLHNAFYDASAPAGSRVTVIDFGQARMDVWLSDLVKLFQHGGDDAPTRRQALLEGYGRRLGAGEGLLFDRLRALHGLATWVWSSDHGDARGVRVGRLILEDAVATLA